MLNNYWLWRLNQYGSPESLQRPPVVGGIARVSIGREDDETAASYRARVQEWVEFFNGQPAIPVVLVVGRANDVFMEAVTQLKSLRALYFKDTALGSADCLMRAPQLRYVHLNFAHKLSDIEALGGLGELVGLGLCPARRVSSFESLRSLVKLRQLRLGHPGGKPQPVQSLDPVIGNGKFTYLDLGDVKVADGDWRPLLRLRGLRSLVVPRAVPMEIFKEVCVLNPSLRSEHATRCS